MKLLLVFAALAILAVGCTSAASDQDSGLRPSPTATVSEASQTPTPEVQPTGTLIATPTATIEPAFSGSCRKGLAELTATEKVSGDLLLTETKGYEVVYMVSNRGFVVRILRTFEQGKAEAQQWFSDHGCSLADLCLIAARKVDGLTLQFAADKWVRPEFSAADALPSGCEVVPAPTPIPG